VDVETYLVSFRDRERRRAKNRRESGLYQNTRVDFYEVQTGMYSRRTYEMQKKSNLQRDLQICNLQIWKGNPNFADSLQIFLQKSNLQGLPRHPKI